MADGNAERDKFVKAFGRDNADRLIAEGVTFDAAIEREVARLEIDLATGMFPGHAIRIRNLRAMLAV